MPYVKSKELATVLYWTCCNLAVQEVIAGKLADDSLEVALENVKNTVEHYLFVVAYAAFGEKTVKNALGMTVDQMVVEMQKRVSDEWTKCHRAK